MVPLDLRLLWSCHQFFLVARFLQPYTSGRPEWPNPPALTRPSIASRSGKRKATDRNKKPTAAPTPSRERKARSAAIDALDKLDHLRDTLLAFNCLQGFLTPQHLHAFEEEFPVDPNELRALVTCINAETRRRLLAVGESIESMRQALH